MSRLSVMNFGVDPRTSFEKYDESWLAGLYKGYFYSLGTAVGVNQDIFAELPIAPDGSSPWRLFEADIRYLDARDIGKMAIFAHQDGLVLKIMHNTRWKRVSTELPYLPAQI